jgi:hypothetical protein
VEETGCCKFRTGKPEAFGAVIFGVVAFGATAFGVAAFGAGLETGFFLGGVAEKAELPMGPHKLISKPIDVDA